MNLVLLGSGGFVIPVFESLRLEHRVLQVFTREPAKAGRKQVETKTPVQEWAEVHGIQVKFNINEFKGEDVDFAVVMSYGVIIPDDVLAKCKFINVHPSDLPKYRGPSPIRTALRNGDTRSAVCLCEMVHDVDAGPVYCRVPFDIGPDETNAMVQQKVSGLTIDLLRDFLSNPPAHPPKEQEGQVILTRKTTHEDKVVDYNMEARVIHNRIRAYGSALLPVGGVMCKLLETKMVGEDKLKIVRIQPCGKKEMDWKTFRNGHQVSSAMLVD